MTVIYIWLTAITIMQLIQWAAQSHINFKIRELEKVFKKMDELTDKQQAGFTDSYNKIQQMHNTVATMLIEVKKILNKQ